MIDGKNFIFTSESVCSGHPDKICDSISDSILDEVLKQDPYGKVAVETLVTYGRIVLAGEISANAKVNFESVARKRIKQLGYTNPLFNFTDKSPIDIYIHHQSNEIARGVNRKGAGDQGMMFGYACRETKNLMPLPVSIAHKLAEKLDEEKIKNPFLYPDGKTQVTVEYKNSAPYKINQVVIAVPHSKDLKHNDIKDFVYENIVKKVLGDFGFKIHNKNLIVNGTGVWHMPGPASDTGVTGRKIIVDTYGGYARVGGGAFSGKDATKVDRSGAYAARLLAKNIVASNMAEKAEVRLAYFIGAKKPVMQDVETFGTERKEKKVILDFMEKIMDTSVEGIIEGLELRKPVYLKTSTYGHFGRSKFNWEKIVS
ncbi:MAG: methionine adenosyltransferase [Candidatus Levybacteria bacterium RIFCSPLOWO2_01_FULL_36_13]|nr:MAG: methionine adenosyltransferase [Candidatus Levybacteria bacterium RIFCSPHIGHO2_01_FULL_36_15b]OGH34308.1 MAG: methionine adenosyltransferase [Candidatus Levybacteria bacterium RIFCSPLOWO2_01_FULL_36_13]